MPEAVLFTKLQLKDKHVEDLLWIENKLVFNGDRFREVLHKLERWYNKTIIVQHNDLDKEVFTGQFEEKSCEELLDLLKKTGVAIQYESRNDTLFIK